MSQQVRSHVAQHLRSEMTRRGFDLPKLESLSGIHADVLSEYLAGTREIRFIELRLIFGVLGVTLMQVLTANYPSPGRQKKEVHHEFDGVR